MQLLIHADIGVNYTTTRSLSLGYMFTDKDGRIVESQAATARLKPMMEGVPSPLQFTGGAALPPGDYTLKIAVVDGDLAGSLEHPVHATLLNAGDISLSELMVGGPVDPTELAADGRAHGEFRQPPGVPGGIRRPGQGPEGQLRDCRDARRRRAAGAPTCRPRAAGDERAIFNRVASGPAAAARQLHAARRPDRGDRPGEESAEPRCGRSRSHRRPC